MGFWERQTRTVLGGFVHILTPFSTHLEKMQRENGQHNLCREKIAVFLRQHMEAVRDQRGSVLSRRTHKRVCNANFR